MGEDQRGVSVASATAPLDILLPYQREMLACDNPVVVIEKSRRIGASWAAALKAVLLSAATAAAGGSDTLYIGYNLEMAREFIADAAFWAGAVAAAAAETGEVVVADGAGAIRAFRIRFASGFEIVALSSRPRSLRGRQGFVVIDEAAFHDDLAGLLKAALALLMWGGRVWAISTHDGDDNPFNELVEDSRAGKTGYRLFRFTFDDAVRQGLYKRICLKTRQAWTAAGESRWVAEIRRLYRDDAAEELDVIPAGGKGTYFTRAMLLAVMRAELPVRRLACAADFEQRPDAARAAVVDDWLEAEIDPLLARLDTSRPHFFGEDFGRSGDLTVIWPYQRRADRSLLCPFVVELRRVPFREQERILFHIVDRLPRFTAGAMDARGNGQYLAEVAMQRYGEARIARVMADGEFYRRAFAALKATIEDKGTEVPRDADLLADHRLVRMETGVPKIPERARRRGADGHERHGDGAIAHLMAHHATELAAAPIEHRATGTKRVGLGAFGTAGGGNDYGGYGG